MTRTPLIVALSLVITACSSDIDRARLALEETMIIKDELEFHDLREYPGNVVCGTFSGYTSYSEPRQLRQQFLYIGEVLDKAPPEADVEFYCNEDHSAALEAMSGIGPFTPDNKALIAVTRDMGKLATALASYYKDNYYYPSTEQGLQALVSAPQAGRKARAYREGGYLDALPVDPWGNAYGYEAEQWGRTKGHYTITSLGASGQPGGAGDAADISSVYLPYMQHLAQQLGVD